MKASSGTFRRLVGGPGHGGFGSTVHADRMVGASFGDVRRAIRVCLAGLVEQAFPSTDRHGSGVVAGLFMRHWSRWLRVPVDVEVSSASHGRPGQVAHLRWRARRFQRFFPVMEADLVLRPSGKGVELDLEGDYRPPLGFVGFIGDLLVGRLVAQSTADAFVERLGAALEGAVIRGRCAPPSATQALGEVA